MDLAASRACMRGFSSVELDSNPGSSRENDASGVPAEAAGVLANDGELAELAAVAGACSVSSDAAAGEDVP